MAPMLSAATLINLAYGSETDGEGYRQTYTRREGRSWIVTSPQLHRSTQEKEREGERDRQTETENARDRETDRQRQRETETETDRNRDRNRETQTEGRRGR